MNHFPAAQGNHGHTLHALAGLVRGLYPHDHLSNGPYRRAAARILAESQSDPELSTLVGVAIEVATRELGSIETSRAEQLTTWWESHEPDPYFAAIRARVCFHLYDDREVWEHLGYPGASYALGGYVHRGFDALDWLPTPRVEEWAESPVELGPLPARVSGGTL